MKNKNTHKRNTREQPPETIYEHGFPVPDKGSVLIFTLGGVGQIGMNWTLYGHDGQWILVDAGSAFAPRDLPIVDAVFPDLSAIQPIVDRLRALIVTHAHEDHIGAIHRLWPKMVNVPIYATPFARAALKNRFTERDTDKDVRINTFVPGQTFGVGSFKVKTVNMTHSAPECVALAIKTRAGTVFHTGDWKFDRDPVVGKPTDFEAIKEIGERGVLAMVCDSTNASRPGKLTSEADLAEGFRKVFAKTKGMVVVSCFSTNIARLATTLRAAHQTGREVAVAGTSLLKNEKIARQLGLLEGVPEPLAHHRHLKGLDRHQMVLLCTGAQGESRAALARLSTGDDYRLPSLEVGDAVIHSARVIPGNEEDIEAVFDRFRWMGVDVHEAEYEGLPLHVTGHATSAEIAKMYDLVRPRFAVTVHGNAGHLAAHAAIASSAGVKSVVVPSEGQIHRIDRKGVGLLSSHEVPLQAELDDQSHSKIPWDEARVREVLAEIDVDRSEPVRNAPQSSRSPQFERPSSPPMSPGL